MIPDDATTLLVPQNILEASHWRVNTWPSDLIRSTTDVKTNGWMPPEQLLNILNIIPGPRHGQSKGYSLGNFSKDIRKAPFSIHLLMLKTRQNFYCN